MNRHRLTRRDVLVLSAGAAGALATSIPAAAEGDTETHGMSAFGDLKYPAGFRHFDYVDPNAP